MELYGKLLELLDGRGARYRLIDHPPEGRTEIVSGFRGNAPSQAAKCILLMVKIGKKAPRNIRKAKRVSPVKKMMASGIQAIGGMKRKGSSTDRVPA